MPIGIKSLLAFFSCFFKRNCLSRLFNLDLYYNYPYYISYMTHSFMVKHSLKKFFFFFESFIPGVAVCYQQLRITIDVIRTCKCFGIKVRTFFGDTHKFWLQILISINCAKKATGRIQVNTTHSTQLKVWHLLRSRCLFSKREFEQ